MRWVFLAGAIVLHGLISLFMGLGTFALVMLVMNMAFLRTEEVHWLVSWLGGGEGSRQQTAGSRQQVGAVVTAIKT